jgi:hypothetical protein
MSAFHGGEARMASWLSLSVHKCTFGMMREQIELRCVLAVLRLDVQLATTASKPPS